MKKLGVMLIGFIAAGSFSSCMKENEPYDPQLQYEIDKELIEEYVLDHFPDAMFHEDDFGYGLWYELIEPGVQGEYEYKLVDEENPQQSPIEAPIIQVRYTGKLLDGTQFEAREGENGVEFSLAGVIPGWQMIFLPTQIDEREVSGVLPGGLHPGAKVRFVIPSIYGYGPDGSGSTIPPNAPLDYTIEVLDVRAPSSN